jgi:hypothetical protein
MTGIIMTRFVRLVLIVIAALGVALIAVPKAFAATAPPTPIDLFNSHQACAADVSSPTLLYGGGGIIIEALDQDTNASDAPYITENFQVWPVADPTQITALADSVVSIGDEGAVTVSARDLSNGQTYAWEAQATAASGTSGWSAPCYFTIDDTPPANPPTVTSSNYPEGQADPGGTPARFTFGASGDSDVVGYGFAWFAPPPVPITSTIGEYGIPDPVDPFTADPTNFIAASTLGGSATVSLIPPGGAGPMILYVESFDQAYNVSSISTYSFSVDSTGPTITPLDSNPQFGQRETFRFVPNAALQATSPVVSYTVQFTGNTEQTVTVKAKPDGTANVSFRLNGPSGDIMYVTSTSADGWVSNNAIWIVQFDTTPTVSSVVYPENGSGGGVGVPGTFTFAPKVNGIASYTYSFNSGTPVTVKAGPHGPASITWTPDASGFYDLNVYATTKDGVQLMPYDYFFTVN